MYTKIYYSDYIIYMYIIINNTVNNNIFTQPPTKSTCNFVNIVEYI